MNWKRNEEQNGNKIYTHIEQKTILLLHSINSIYNYILRFVNKCLQFFIFSAKPDQFLIKMSLC